MKDSIQTRCEQFIRNRDRIKENFGWENAYLYPLCAAIFTLNEKEAEGSLLKNCVGILKQQTGVFSGFRSIIKLPVVSIMAVSEEPDAALARTLRVYELLKENFMASHYLPVAAVAIAQLAEEQNYEYIARRTKEIYKEMKANHPMLTSGEDSAFAALLSLSQKPNEQLITGMEQCYEILKPNFFSGNAVQSLSQVLALGDGMAAEKCSKTLALFDRLKERGYKYGTSYELPTLGVLALSEGDVRDIVSDMMEADDFLAGQKGFGAFGVGKRQRLMYAGMLVQAEYLERNTLQTAAINGPISMIVAQQAAMCAAVAAAAAASSSSSSS